MERLKADVRRDIIDKIRDGVGEGSYGADLHHDLCNTDYFIIGTYQAKQWLGSDVWDVIQLVTDWERDNLGEGNCLNDPFDPERFANLAAYVLGSEILGDSQTLADKWDDCLTLADLKVIADELAKPAALDSMFTDSLTALDKVTIGATQHVLG